MRKNNNKLSADAITQLKESIEVQKKSIKDLIACIKVMQSYKALELHDMKISAKHPAKWAYDQRIKNRPQP